MTTKQTHGLATRIGQTDPGTYIVQTDHGTHTHMTSSDTDGLQYDIDMRDDEIMMLKDKCRLEYWTDKLSRIEAENDELYGIIEKQEAEIHGSGEAIVELLENARNQEGAYLGQLDLLRDQVNRLEADLELRAQVIEQREQAANQAETTVIEYGQELDRLQEVLETTRHQYDLEIKRLTSMLNFRSPTAAQISEKCSPNDNFNVKDLKIEINNLKSDKSVLMTRLKEASAKLTDFYNLAKDLPHMNSNLTLVLIQKDNKIKYLKQHISAIRSHYEDLISTLKAEQIYNLDVLISENQSLKQDICEMREQISAAIPSQAFGISPVSSKQSMELEPEIYDRLGGTPIIWTPGSLVRNYAGSLAAYSSIPERSLTRSRLQVPGATHGRSYSRENISISPELGMMQGQILKP